MFRVKEYENERIRLEYFLNIFFYFNNSFIYNLHKRHINLMGLQMY